MRCDAFLTPSHTFRRCKQDALPGSKFCERHQPQERPSNYLPRSYIYKLRPTVAALVEDQIESSELMSQLKLDEELALIRLAAGDFVNMWQSAKEFPDKVPLDAQLAMSTAMTEALKTVVSTVESVGKLQELQQRLKMSLAPVLEQVITAVLHAAQDTWGQSHKVGEFEQNIRDRLKTHAIVGTTITPDQDVLAMDATVP